MTSLDLRPDLDTPFRVFGVPATVAPKDTGEEIATTVLWPVMPRMTPAEMVPGIAPAVVLNNRESIDIRRDQVPSLPTGSTIWAPRTLGGTVCAWRVVHVDASDPDVWSVQVVAA